MLFSSFLAADAVPKSAAALLIAAVGSVSRAPTRITAGAGAQRPVLAMAMDARTILEKCIVDEMVSALK